jgi:hypothetical protein
MILSKYAVAIVQVVTLIVASLVAAQSGDGVVTDVEAWQIAALGAGGVATYLVPLLEKGWAALLKFVTALVAAGVAALVPIIDTANGGPGWSGSAWLIVILAILNAALTAAGVSVRTDAVKAALASPDVSDRIPVSVDGKAVKVVLADGDAGPPRAVG